MIKTVHGDLLELVTSGVIVHGCNAQGKMNSGFAKAVREKYPIVFDSYSYFHAVESGKRKLLRKAAEKVYGESPRERANPLLGLNDYCAVTEDLFVVNMITQEFYGHDPDVVYVNYGALKGGFARLGVWLMNRYLRFGETPVVSFPAIGCGLAKGDWSIVSKIIDTFIPDVFEKHLYIKLEST